ncbi:hypothetical protein BD410DRAFT_794819 [Rickenella mellea]|uniref:Uncharacterized protein n=1 Tax=Rickenella mellea TaxID=50990 RepID=A0A4Y7PPY1_9AGAM|nr:hypothetical protein BD410DRAFT_794819 [Rickenella mellea]
MIHFIPDLKTRTAVPTSVGGTLSLTFRARLSPERLHELRRDGANVEVWTDIPGESSNPGEWRAQPFEEVPTPQNPTHTTLRVASQPIIDVAQIAEPELQTTFVLPNTPRKVYSFTYRLVFPSGDIQWLGGHDANGSLEILSEDGLFTEVGGWSATGGDRRIFASAETHGVALGTIPKDVTKFALCDRSVKIFTDEIPDERFSTLIIVPSPNKNEIAMQRPLIVHSASKTTSLSSTRDTLKLHTSAAGAAERWTFDGSSDEDCRLLRAQIMSSGQNPLILHLSSHGLVFSPCMIPNGSSTVYVIPFGAGHSFLSLSLESLMQFSPLLSPHICLQCPETLEWLFLDPKNDQHNEISIYHGQSGGSFIVSIFHHMTNDATWKLACPTLTVPPEILFHRALPDQSITVPAAESSKVRSPSITDTTLCSSSRTSNAASNVGIRLYIAQTFSIATLILGMACGRMMAFVRMLTGARRFAGWGSTNGGGNSSKAEKAKKGGTIGANGISGAVTPNENQSRSAQESEGDVRNALTTHSTFHLKATVGETPLPDHVRTLKWEVPPTTGHVSFLLFSSTGVPTTERLRATLDSQHFTLAERCLRGQTAFLETEDTLNTGGTLELSLATL